MKILFLSRWFPWPTDNGSKLRIYNLLRGLAQKHEVTLISFSDSPEADSTAPELQAICSEVQTVAWMPFQPKSKRSYVGFLKSTPRSLVDTFSPEMSRRIVNTLASDAFDLVIASQITMAHYRDCFGDTPALYEEVELGVFYEQYANASSWQSRIRNGLTWSKHRRYLAHQVRDFSACTVVSENERVLLADAAPGFEAVEVMPNCIELADYERRYVAQPNSLIFTGPFGYHANYEAMQWFLSEAYPRVQAQIPEISLTITGDHRGLPLPPAQNVTLTGFVDDVHPLLAQSWISLAPLMTGGGTRLKILEAMASGVPVVSTTKGAEGLDVEPDVHLLVADDPAGFAQAIVRLCNDDDLRTRITNCAFALVRDQYTWSSRIDQFLALVERTSQAEKRNE